MSAPDECPECGHQALVSGRCRHCRWEADARDAVAEGIAEARARIREARAREPEPPSDAVREAPAQRKSNLAFQLADECGLSRADRIELAEVLLRRDVGSWKELDDFQMGRLIDAMRGWQYVEHLRGR